jgi:hypothetical protein
MLYFLKNHQKCINSVRVECSKLLQVVYSVGCVITVLYIMLGEKYNFVGQSIPKILSIWKLLLKQILTF